MADLGYVVDLTYDFLSLLCICSNHCHSPDRGGSFGILGDQHHRKMFPRCFVKENFELPSKVYLKFTSNLLLRD